MSSQKEIRVAKERRIFRYTLSDAWKTTISQVDVMEGVEKGNVRCLYFDKPRLTTPLLTSEEIEEIEYGKNHTEVF